MQQQNKCHIAKHQENKNHPIFVQTAKYCKRSFSLSSEEFTISNLWPVVGTLPTTTTNCITKTKLKKHTKLYDKNPETKSKSALKS